MFYYATKILGIFSFGSNIAIAFGLFGLLLALLTPLRRSGRFLMGLSLLCIAVLGFTPVGNLILAPLENRFPPANLNAGAELKGIIVLGGAIETHISTQRGQPALTEAAERMTVVPDLARRFPHAQIIFTGGIGLLQDQFFDDKPEADAAKTLWESLGIPPERLVFEDKSRNTEENARFTHDLLKPGPGDHYLLVTSAYHMPRSMALFRKAGFTVEPWPVDYRTGGPQDAVRFFYSLSDGLRQSDLGIREWIGLYGYYFTGRIDEAFPKP
jgi:uncharacterized SAM-binding protein YcdF (DUF218 family)